MSRSVKSTRRRGSGRGASRRQEAVPRRGGLLRVCKRLLQGSLLLAVVGATVFGVQVGYSRLQAQKVATVLIEGSLDHVDERSVKQAMAPFMQQGMVSIDLVEVQQVLESLPWVRRATVRREWPDAMVLQLDEQVAIARWGEDALLNQQGEIFRPRGGINLNQLPVLTGPVGEEYDVMLQYQRFNRLLYPLGQKLISLDKNRRGAWELVLASGVRVRLGKQELMLRMRRLVAFLDEVERHGEADIQAIDLRYAHGLAVTWDKSMEGAAGLQQEAVVAR